MFLAPLADVLCAEPKFAGGQLRINQNPKRRRPRAYEEQHDHAVRVAAKAKGAQRQEGRHWHEDGEDEQGLQQRPDQAVALAKGLGLRTFIILSFRGDDSILSSPTCPCCTLVRNFNNLRRRQHGAFVTSP